MIKPILKWPNTILNQRSSEVVDFNDDLKILAQDLKDTLIESKGVGLSGVQIGVLKRVCVITWVSGMSRQIEYLTMVNPVIIERGGDTYVKEGCLSMPGLFVPIRVASELVVRYQGLDGAEHFKSFSDEICPKGEGCCGGVLARCVQHEEEGHMDGLLIIDRIPKFNRSEAIKKYKRLNK